MMNLKIVNLNREHISDLVKIESEAFSCPWTESGFIEEIYNENARFRVAEINDVVAGYMGMYSIYDQGYIANIAVLKRFRNNGIAKKLMEDSFEYGNKANLEFISLEVRKSNEIAITFYKKMGFLEVGTRKGFYVSPNEDAIIMTKFLK